jgi:hypothetical protein
MALAGNTEAPRRPVGKGAGTREDLGRLGRVGGPNRGQYRRRELGSDAV